MNQNPLAEELLDRADNCAKGYVRDDTWNWTIGGLIYFSTTAAALTQTAPSGTGDQVQIAGIASTADIMFFDPSMVLGEIT